MDFSSVERALQSLGRRRPELEHDVVELASNLLASDCSNEEYLQGVLSLIQTNLSSRWEPLAVGLYVATDLITSNTGKEGSSVYVEGPRVPSVKSDADSSTPSQTHQLSTDQLVSLCGPLLEACRLHLEDSEPRVRTLVAKAVGAHVKLSCQLLEIAELQDQRGGMHDSIVASLHEHLKVGRDLSDRNSKSSTGALDDTTGWRALETNWQGLASYIAACGPVYLQENELDEALLEACRYSCITHVNRHVRAAAIAVLEQLVLAISPGQSSQLTDVESPLRTTIVQVLKVTLADNWSQVRMAASVLCRTFFTTLLQYDDNHADAIYPLLLPRMCLNRFYLAQGVKLYSHDTWKMVFPNNGLELVAQHAGAVCRYYVKMCDADNHAVREAACQAVAELAQKLGNHETLADNLAPYVPMLLQALLMCFHDESWPVRDEACLACGTFCVAYPEECRPELNTLLERWTEQLTDQIWSVREDAAVALGDALKAYPELFDKFINLLKEKLPSAKDQPAMTKEEAKKRQNDIESHTDSQLYSCGSLAPKLRKGGAGRIGCSSCGITRPKAPWEATDGCIYLLRELCTTCSPDLLTDEILMPLMSTTADVCRVRHFPQGDDLRTTLWRQLPIMARHLGKQRFKRLYLELFLDLLMSNLDERTASALSVHAAGQCAEELAALVGAGIFRGRLDDYQQEVLDRVLRERQQAPKGPAMMNEAFSPFGPPGLVSSGVSPFGTAAVGAGMGHNSGAAATAFPPQAAGVPGSGLTDTL